MTSATSLSAPASPGGSLSSLDMPLLASNGVKLAPTTDADSETPVVYFYPGIDVSPEDGLQSAAHDLAQHLAFASHDLAFRALGCRVLGVSTQPHATQAHDAQTARISHLLLSDPQLSLAAALGLRTFSNGENTHFYSRALLIVLHDAGPVFLNVVVPGQYPASALAWLREQAN